MKNASVYIQSARKIEKRLLITKNSHVTRDMYLVHGEHGELDLLPLKLEYPSAFKVAAAECGAGDDIPRQILHIRPDIDLAWSVTHG
jgi:hypothetical protein